MRFAKRLPLRDDLLEVADDDAASPCNLSDKTVLKAEVLVST